MDDEIKEYNIGNKVYVFVNNHTCYGEITDISVYRQIHTDKMETMYRVQVGLEEKWFPANEIYVHDNISDMVDILAGL